MDKTTQTTLDILECLGEYLSDIKILREAEAKTTKPYVYLSALRNLRKKEIQLTNAFLDALGNLIAKTRKEAN